MPSTDPPTVNVINVASDDAIWVMETDLTSLQTILEDPVACVAKYVTINGRAAVLYQPFVVMFHEMAPTSKPDQVILQGIDGTPMLTVKHTAQYASSEPKQTLPPAEQHDIFQQGNHTYSHVQYTGHSPAEVATAIIHAVTSPDSHFAELNQLKQSLNGKPVEPGKELKFGRNTTHPTKFVYEGWTAKPSTDVIKAEDDSDPPPVCEVNMGDCDANGNVIVDGVVIKTYLMPPPGN